MSQFFPSGGQSIGASSSASVLPMNIQDWFPLGWTGLTYLQSKGLSKIFSRNTVQKMNSLAFCFLYGAAFMSIHDYWKSHSFEKRTFVGKVMSMLFNMLSRLVIDFVPQRKCLDFMAAVIICSDFGAQDKKVCHSFVSPSICHEVMGLDATILIFWVWSFKPAFSLPFFTFHQDAL